MSSGPTVFWLAIAMLLVAPQRIRAQDAPLLPAEAREVLERFVGAWSTETDIVHAGSDRHVHAVGEAEGRWRLEGRFVEFRGHSIPSGESDLQVMTFDAARGRFEQWPFDSSGYTHGAEGCWDAASSTLVWEATVEGEHPVIRDRFVGADRLEWTMERSDAAGRILSSIHDTVTRRAGIGGR